MCEGVGDDSVQMYSPDMVETMLMFCSLSVVDPRPICSHPIGIMDWTEWSHCSASVLVDSGASTLAASTANALFVLSRRFSGRTQAG